MNAKLLSFCTLFFLISSFTIAQNTWISSGNNMYYTKGNIGIGGVASSTYKLDINGDMKVKDISFVRNGMIGYAIHSTNERFTYNGVEMGSLALSWIVDPKLATNGYSTWLTGWGGMKFFTNNAPAMTIRQSGYIGIGTETPSQKLSVVGKISAYNSGLTPEETYQGQLILTKPYAGGQFINLVSAARIPWSIGTLYNQSTFAISEGKTSDSQFTAPYFTIARGGNVGIATASATQKLSVKGRIAVSPDGIVSDEGYNGQVMITKPAESGQYINLIRSAKMGWSIGTMYNSSVFCIAGSKARDSDFNTPLFTMTGDGNVGIGVVNTSGYKLMVDGLIKTKEIRVELTGWPDYVFEDSYELPSLDDVASHIQEKKRLPGIPSAAEVEENGVGLAEMNAKLLQKIEELTLYTIQQQKAIDELVTKVSRLENIKE